MKKVLLVLFSLFLMTGCNKQIDNKKINDDLSFDYDIYAEFDFENRHFIGTKEKEIVLNNKKQKLIYKIYKPYTLVNEYKVSNIDYERLGEEYYLWDLGVYESDVYINDILIDSIQGGVDVVEAIKNLENPDFVLNNETENEIINKNLTLYEPQKIKDSVTGKEYFCFKHIEVWSYIITVVDEKGNIILKEKCQWNGGWENLSGDKLINQKIYDQIINEHIILENNTITIAGPFSILKYGIASGKPSILSIIEYPHGAEVTGGGLGVAVEYGGTYDKLEYIEILLNDEKHIVSYVKTDNENQSYLNILIDGKVINENIIDTSSNINSKFKDMVGISALHDQKNNKDYVFIDVGKIIIADLDGNVLLSEKYEKFSLENNYLYIKNNNKTTRYAVVNGKLEKKDVTYKW